MIRNVNQYVLAVKAMKCPMCNDGKFKPISLVTYDGGNKWHDEAYNSLHLARANLTEFPKGNFEMYEVKKDHYGEAYTSWETKEGERLPNKEKHGAKYGYSNWVTTTKVCVSCGYIAMFLPLKELREKKEKDAIAAERMKQEKAARKRRNEEKAAAKKKKEVEDEKERLKKRLAELEDEG